MLALGGSKPNSRIQLQLSQVAPLRDAHPDLCSNTSNHFSGPNARVELPFPSNNHAPAELLKLGNCTSVARYVPVELLLPIGGVRLRRCGDRAFRIPMPKTAVDKNSWRKRGKARSGFPGSFLLLSVKRKPDGGAHGVAPSLAPCPTSGCLPSASIVAPGSGNRAPRLRPVSDELVEWQSTDNLPWGVERLVQALVVGKRLDALRNLGRRCGKSESG